MSLKSKRILTLAGIIVLILSGPLTVWMNTPFSGVTFGTPAFYNLLLRVFGLVGFTLIVIQIVSGSLMKRIWVQIMGASGYKLHITFGIATAIIVFTHPVFYYLIAYEAGYLRDILIPDITDPFEIYLLYGRFALFLLVVASLIAYFRTKRIFRRIWRRIHLLNYFIYVLVVLHATGAGTDFMSFPFNIVYILSIPLVTASVAQRLYSFYQSMVLN